MCIYLNKTLLNIKNEACRSFQCILNRRNGSYQRILVNSIRTITYVFHLTRTGVNLKLNIN